MRWIPLHCAGLHYAGSLYSCNLCSGFPTFSSPTALSIGKACKQLGNWLIRSQSVTGSKFHLYQIPIKEKYTFEKLQYSHIFYKPDLNETLNQSLTGVYSINCITIYMANKAHQKEAIYELLKECKIFTKFNICGLYSTPIALYVLM